MPVHSTTPFDRKHTTLMTVNHLGYITADQLEEFLLLFHVNLSEAEQAKTTLHEEK